MSDDILYEEVGYVRLITINRPVKMNSLDFSANEDLINAFKQFDSDKSARIAVLTGSGEASFCAGADLKNYTMNFATTPSQEFRETYTNGYGLGGITRNLNIYKPTIAAINGYAMSGGFEIALACDMRLCSPNAIFALQDVKWGFHACDGALVRLPHIIGLSHTMEMFLTGDRYDADWAYRVGLVNRIINQDLLVEESLRLAHELANRSPLAHRQGKETILHAIGRPLPEGLRFESSSFRDLGDSADLAEGTKAFSEKRDAVFNGN
jgi:enoyl-CoA hydratase/carnithine racemase